MLNFMLLLSRALADCNWGYYPNPDTSSSTVCLKCNIACGNCSGPTEFDCGQCNPVYSSINGICMANCPLGYTNNANQCNSLTSDGIAYNLNFAGLTNTIVQTVNLNSQNIQVTAGSTLSFYPYYDPHDPYTIEYRGFYFNGSAYFINQDTSVTFGPTFFIATWLKPLAGTGFVFCKQNSTYIYVAIELAIYVPSFVFYLSGEQTYNSGNSLVASQWNFLMVKLVLTNRNSAASMTVNTQTTVSSTYSSYFTDMFSGFSTTYGAQLSGTTYQNFYTGYMWSFELGSNNLDPSTFIQTSGCSGCSYCPTSNSNQCISSCPYTQYIANGTCLDCSFSCQTFGCVRDDKSCNLCQDRLCLNCSTFGAGCTYCIANAFLGSSSLCQCYNGYVWDDFYEKCKPCSPNCATCDGGGYLGCSKCNTGYYMNWGICWSFCPTGYEVSGDQCVLSGSKTIMDMRFNNIQGVVYDLISSIPAVTGSTSTFYPNYESNDPIAAYWRGYYFGGTSIMNFAPYSSYSSPYLVFTSVCYIGIWFNPTNANGILFSSVTTSYSTIMQYSLQALTPTLNLGLYSLENTNYSNPVVTCDKQATLSVWNYVLFAINLTTEGQTLVTCYINGVAGKTNNLGEGIFYDNYNSHYMLAGTQAISGGYNSNYYVGFIYEIVVNVDISNPNYDISFSCGSGCSFCPANGTCLPACSLGQYPSGNTCLACNSACLSTGCKDSSNRCNLCADYRCKVCTDYTSMTCSQYFCGAGTYLDTSVWSCANCDSSCTTCSGPGPTNCTGCGSNYLLNGVCFGFVPTGYTASNNVCTQILNKIVSLNLLEIYGVVPDTQSGLNALAGSSSSFYPNFDTSDPIPQIYRGYYFNGNSYLQMPPNSAKSGAVTFGSNFTFAMWIRSEKDGVLVTKQNSAYNTYILIQVLNSKISVTLNLQQSSTVASSTTLLTQWSYVIVIVQFAYPGTTSVTFTINGMSETPAADSGPYSDLASSYTMTIGAKQSSSGYSTYWTGFLYTFDIYSSATSPTDYTSTCSQVSFSCSICPSSTAACLNTCAHNFWYSGSTCTQCQASSYNSCRRNDKNCNLCFDIQCLVCSTFESGSCTQCVPNASLDGKGGCDCSDGYTWSQTSETCVVCNPQTNVKLQGVCLTSCPTGYTNTNGDCTGTPGKIFNIQMDQKISGVLVDTVNGVISVNTGLTSEFYPYYDNDDPYAGKNRGYYFNGYSSYLNFVQGSSSSQQLVLSPEFAIGMWIYPVASGVIFAKQSAGSLGVLIQVLAGGQIQVAAQLSGASSVSVVNSTQSVAFNQWNYVGVTCTVAEDLTTAVTIQINSNSESHALGSSPYIDSTGSSVTCTIGAEYNSSGILNNYYTGYIQSVTVWNTNQDLSSQVMTSCTGGCSTCPPSGTCFPSCGLSSYPSASSCQSCSSLCTQGCVRSSDCNLCYDQLCQVCSDYTSTGCTQCVDGATMVGGVCQCSIGSAMKQPNGDLYCNTTCMVNCQSCYQSFEGQCTACVNGTFLDPSGICVAQCQSGSSVQAGICVQNGGNKAILHYVFNMTVNDPPDETANLLAFMGSTSNFVGNFDVNDPIPYYGRGIYFNGQQKYVQLPQDPAESVAIVLGNTHSIKFWLRASSSSSSGCLLTKESPSPSSQSLYVYLTPSLLAKSQYTVSDIYSGTTSTLTSTSSALTADTWCELVLIFQRSGRSSTATFYLNGQKSATTYLTKTFFSEPAGLNFTLGYSQVAGTSFTGFIYEFVIYNFVINPTNPAANPCSCGFCTDFGDCLSSCEITQYIQSDGTCATCPSQCPSNCRSATVCGQNTDPYCQVYSGFSNKQCTQCIPLAQESSQSLCTCVPNSQLINNACVCNTLYENVANLCAPCFYHLQTTDITGFFSQDYLSLVFNMSMPVQSSTSSSCISLFVNTTLLMLGTSPVCSWSNGYTTLNVKFGWNAKVVNGTQIQFAFNSLLTNKVVCGSNRGPISDYVWYVYSIPQEYPDASITAPYDYYMYCGDLVVSGSDLNGGYGRDPSYMWTFSPAPYVSAFNLTNLTQQSYDFSNTSLTTTTLNVNLTVTNWLGFSNSTSAVVNVHTGVGIYLKFDQNIVWTMTTQMSKSVYVEPTTQCPISSDLTYSWSLFSQTGPDASINKQLFWSSQKTPSKLYIPKGSLGPGVYVFQLLVHDNTLNVDGRAYLTITVVYSDLEINFNPSYKTVNRLSDLILDGSAASDPDNLSGSMAYNWTCSGVPNCSSLITNSGSEFASVSKSLLANLAEYNFTLTVTKGNRTASGTLTVHINDSSTVSVTFSSIPKYVNNQENFVIRSYLNPPCNCTYYWQILSGGPYNLSTDATSKDLGLVPFSLTVGATYVAQMTVTDVNGGVSVFRDSFTVDIPPAGGSFDVSIANGIEETTWIGLYANNWKDSEDSSLPLTYQFGYYKENGTYYLNVKNESSFFFTQLPAGSPVNVFVRVYDMFGAFSEVSIGIDIATANLSLPGLIQDFEGFVNTSWRNPDILVGYLCNLAWVLKESVFNQTYNDLAFNASVDAVAKLRDSLQDIDFSKIDVLLKMTSVATLYNLTLSSRSELFQLLSSFTQLVADNSVIMSEDRCGSYVDVILKIMTFTPNIVRFDAEDLSQANEILKQLAIASSITMGQTQYFLFGTAPVQSYLKLYSGDKLPSFQTPAAFNHSFVSLPYASVYNYTSSSTIMTVLTVYNADPTLYFNNTQEQSAAVEFSLVELVNNTQVVLSLELTDSLINISVPIWLLNSNPPECVFWDTSKWSMTGCKLLEFSANMSVCGCSHMSLYTSGSYFGGGGDDNGLILIYIVCFVAFLWLILACCLLVKDKKEAESKVFVGKILAALPAGKKAPGYIRNEIADQLGRETPVTGKKGMHIPPSKIEVVDYDYEKKGDNSANMSSRARGNQSSKNEELKNEERQEEEIRNRRLALPLAYQILPSIDFIRKEKPYAESDSFKPQTVFVPTPHDKSKEFEESEKAAGFVPNERNAGVVDFRPDNQSNPDYLPTARFGEVQRLDSAHSVKHPRSELTTSSSTQLKAKDQSANTNSTPSDSPQKIPTKPLTKPPGLEVYDPAAEKLHKPGPGLPKPTALEGSSKQGNPTKGSSVTPSPRLGQLSELEHGRPVEGKKNVSNSDPDDLNIVEFENRPGTDARNMDKVMGMTGFARVNLDASETRSAAPETKSGQFYERGPGLGGIADLEVGDVEVRAQGKKGEYVSGARLPGVTGLSVEGGKGAEGGDRKKGEYVSGPRMGGVTGLDLEGSKVQDPNLRSPLSSPENQDLERKSLLKAKDSKPADYIIAEDFSGPNEKRPGDTRPTQPYEEDIFKKKFNFPEEGKEEIQYTDYAKASLKPPDEKNPENTELFTQPDSPHQRHMLRKKNVDQEAPVFEDYVPIVYPSFIADYYFSAVLFYHDNYSRFARCSQGVCSFMLQALLIGLIVDGMGSVYADDKGTSFEAQVSGILFQDVAVAFSMVIVSNLLVGALLCVFFRRPALMPGMEESYKNRKKEFTGLVIVLIIVLGVVIGVGLIEVTMKHTMSMLWVICLFIGFIFDFFLVQILKVLVFNYFSPALILPT